MYDSVASLYGRHRLVGVIERVTRDSLIFARPRNAVAVPRAQIKRLQVSTARRDPVGRGALVGAMLSIAGAITAYEASRCGGPVGCDENWGLVVTGVTILPAAGFGAALARFSLSINGATWRLRSLR